MDRHDNLDDFLEAVYTDYLAVRDSTGQWWQSWESEDGEWYALRPRNEEDPEGPTGDRYRPVGPIYLERLAFPIQCVVLADALDLKAENARLLRESIELSWAANPERMGR
ncbi:hypothetical protein Q7C18_07345 [Nesterenkonia sp. CL21]|uniref:hypothetical protein n=1 Tax=Nesterenkonia sp. CL21 TaxID=3064894 RepID=UPI0028786A40|nr:hypothetical protein [Nesterenkonia sp. CL21]MDS2172503.1 hypothetical protein [Nesterenkonia sp. CL21]